jgi:hypothetical protein
MGVKGRSYPYIIFRWTLALLKKILEWPQKITGRNTLAYSNVEKSFVIVANAKFSLLKLLIYEPYYLP